MTNFHKHIIFLGLVIASIFSPLVGLSDTRTTLHSKDSTSVQKAEADLLELKRHVSLTKTQEEVVYRLFLGNHLYLDNHEPVGARWELTMRSHLARFRKELGEEDFIHLVDKGLVKNWFRFDQ